LRPRATTAEDRRQLVEVDRLDHVVVEAGLQGGAAVLLLAVAGDRHQQRERVQGSARSLRASSLPSISGRPMSSSAASGHSFFAQFQRAQRIVLHHHLVAAGFQQHGQRGGGVDIVVHHQQAQRAGLAAGAPRRLSRRRARRPASAAGSREAAARPGPGLSHTTVPPCSSTRFLTSARPSPEPALRAVGRALGLGEQVEHAGGQFRLHADALVAHRQHQLRRPLRPGRRSRCGAPRACTWKRC
jgi:hypothetical protein